MTAYETPQRRAVPPFVAALAGLALPGLGYLLAGERERGYLAGITILLLFAAGLLIGGVRVIDVPGYTDDGQRLAAGGPGAAAGDWALTAHPIATVMAKPWFVPQALVGPLAFVAGRISLGLAAAGSIPSHARVAEIGVLYTAVAGGLNLLVVIDAASRAAARRETA